MSKLCHNALLAYPTIYNFENTLRMFLYLVFKEKEINDWQGYALVSENDKNNKDDTKHKDKIRKTKNYGYLLHVDTCPFLYLTLHELYLYITHEKLWKHFEPFFPDTAKQILSAKFEEIISIRNAIAHFRDINSECVNEIIHTIATHFRLVNEFINEALLPFGSPPMNLTAEADPWYLNVCDISFQDRPINIRMSRNGKWVSLSICYHSGIVPVQADPNWSPFPLFSLPLYGTEELLSKLNTPKILSDDYKSLKEATAYTLEKWGGWYSLTDSNRDRYLPTKDVVFVLSRRALKKHYSDIVTDINKLFSDLRKQYDILLTDPVAIVPLLDRMEIVYEDDDKECIDVAHQYVERSGDDPIEYWGPYTPRPWSYREFFENPPFFPWQGKRIVL